ncbi:MAG TPA: UMP kinase, partial [Methanocorpusculum sp.]|nr:UMP kinase [Methanocorpusculum sp.]
YIEAKEFAVSGKIVVMGGITPGQTTDAVAAVLAEETRADLLLDLTAVDGIYTADPKKDPNATKFATMTPTDLITLIMKEKMNAGSNVIIDMVAAKVTERSGIPMLVLDGRDPKIMEDALLSGTFNGTIVGEKAVKLPL